MCKLPSPVCFFAPYNGIPPFWWKRISMIMETSINDRSGWILPEIVVCDNVKRSKSNVVACGPLLPAECTVRNVSAFLWLFGYWFCSLRFCALHEGLLSGKLVQTLIRCVSYQKASLPRRCWYRALQNVLVFYRESLPRVNRKKRALRQTMCLPKTHP